MIVNPHAPAYVTTKWTTCRTTQHILAMGKAYAYGAFTIGSAQDLALNE